VSVRNICEEFYRNAQSVIAPGLKYSQELYEGVLTTHIVDGKSWMDLGCGHQLLSAWRYDQEKKLADRAAILIGFDFDFDAIAKHRTIRLRVQGDISKLPFPNQSFDLVTANMVFEHLQEPRTQLAEIFRVLRPGGRLIFHTPNALTYDVIVARLIPGWIKKKVVGFLEGRRGEDIYPAFYRINSATSIKQLAVQTGFQIQKLKLIVSTPNFIMIPPLMILELLLIRALMSRWLRSFRTNIIAVLEKPAD
jgi:ubiquinone/menaquinone biosynthesis C-methylase UbiE